MPEARRYQYKYAQIDPTLGDMCIGVHSMTSPVENDPNWIEIPVVDEEYCFKYYNRANGQWYEDAEFTIPWQSSLI